MADTRDLTNAALTLGTALRLTRLVVADDIGQWWIKGPVDQAARRWWEHKAHRLQISVEAVPEPWWWKYRSGLDCPFCVGFWIGTGTLASAVIVKGTRAEPVWRFAATALTMNYVAAHLGARLGDTAPDPEEQS